MVPLVCWASATSRALTRAAGRCGASATAPHAPFFLDARVHHHLSRGTSTPFSFRVLSSSPPPPPSRTPVITMAQGDAEKDASYDPSEALVLLEPPQPSHNGFGQPIPTGGWKARSEVHRDGDWHHSVHVWLYCSKDGNVLVQRRSKNKDTNPGRLDVSAAGHINFGTSSRATALIEVEEELGLNLREDQVKLLFTAVSSSEGETVKFGPYTCREFQDVYLVDVNAIEPNSEGGTVEIELAAGEVEEAKWISVAELQDSLLKGDPEYVARAAGYVEHLVNAMG